MLRVSALWRIEMTTEKFATFTEAVEYFEALGYTDLVEHYEDSATYRKLIPGYENCETPFVDIFSTFTAYEGTVYVGVEY